MTHANFKRGITNPKFLEILNKLKQDSGTFWYKILNDNRFFVAIRDNYLNVYFYGQSVAEITYDTFNGTLKYKTHKKYIGENGTGYKYVTNEELTDIDVLIASPSVFK